MSIWDGDVGEAWLMSQTNEIVSDRRLLLLCVKPGIRFIRACQSMMLRPGADGAGASQTAAEVSQAEKKGEEGKKKKKKIII